MSGLRVALCQINTIPGDLPGNRERIERAAREASRLGAGLAVFPELALVGYSPRDLLFRRRFVETTTATLGELAAATAGLQCALLVGTVVARSGRGRPFANAAALIDGGEVRGIFAKSLLPVYDVFDEARYFEPGGGEGPVLVRGTRVGVTICEDLWIEPQGPDVPGYAADPAGELARQGAELIVNLSASPYHQGKAREREALVARTARRLRLPVLLCNLWGGNDEVLFDGASVAVGPDGEVRARARLFGDEVLLVDPSGSGPGEITGFPDPLEELRRALVMGLHDYAGKCGFTDVVIGLSGGIDSAVVAALATEALGPEHVRGVAMPSRFSSPASVEDAQELARRLGIPCDVVPIDRAYEQLRACAQSVVGEGAFGVMEENLQARIRGVILMAISNRTGALVVSTGNKSELAVGYCTLYGDMCGGLAAISDVFKTDVYRLGWWYHGQGRIPERSLTKPPSAELRPDQTDQDTLPPYDLLDRILDLHIEHGLGTGGICEALPEAPRETVERVLTMVARSEYKRKQAAPGLKVTRKAFGVGRRVPLVAASLSFLDRPDAGQDTQHPKAGVAQ